jgi:methylenetetrahydrofolate dehydrogenase (NADP+)/methenyltetrahydrofolate cyclohydrolase
MAAAVIDGKALAERIQAKLKIEVSEISPKLGRKPGLAVVLVGNNPASQVYVKSKTKKALSCGLEVKDVHLPESVTNEELQRKLKELNLEQSVDGILLQLPLPVGLDEFAALLCIAPEKDVDGLHPMNQGLLLRGEDAFEPCTPKGAMCLIREARTMLGLSDDLSGQSAMVIGRSILVGKPMAQLLLAANCTTTVAHSRTKNLAQEASRADIVIAAIGRAEMVTAEFVKPGAIVVDVGINRRDDGRLVGDVAYQAVSEKAAAITPVPGGVGPMTIAMLLQNTVQSAQRKISKK